MAEKQMIIGVEFPTWDTLSTPVKSLIAFFMEDASVYFTGEHIDGDEEENIPDRDICTGALCSNMRYNNIMDGETTPGANITSIYRNCEILMAAKYSNQPDPDADLIDPSCGLPKAFESQIAECESKLNIYFADYPMYTNTAGCWAFIKTANIEPLSNIPVKFKPWLIANDTKVALQEDSHFTVEYNTNMYNSDGENNVAIANIDTTGDSNTDKFNYEYQLQTSTIPIRDLEEDYSYTVYYKIGICPLNKKWSNCYWKYDGGANSLGLTTNDIFRPREDGDLDFEDLTFNEEEVSAVQKLAAYIQSKMIFKIVPVAGDSSDSPACGVCLTKDNDEEIYACDDGNLFPTIVSYDRLAYEISKSDLTQITYSEGDNLSEQTRYRLKTRYILPIYTTESSDPKLIGFCYAKAFNSAGDEEISNNAVLVPYEWYEGGGNENFVKTYSLHLI